METIIAQTGQDTGTYSFQGIGHQLRREQKAMDACRKSLQEAYNDLKELSSPEALEIKLRIDRLITDCLSLSASLDEALNQNS